MLSQVVEEPPPAGERFPDHIYNSSQHVYPLLMHIFPLQKDFPINSAAFVGLPLAPPILPTCEEQAAVAQSVFLNPENLDVEAEKARVVERYETLEREGLGDQRLVARDWHRLGVKWGFEYRKALLGFPGVPGWLRMQPWTEELYPQRGVLKVEWL